MLFLYTLGEKDRVDKYRHNFRSLWDMVEAFGRLPGMHKGLVEELLRNPTHINNVNNMTKTDCAIAKEDVSEAVKAALLISRADKRRYGKLKDELATNYLLGNGQYPDILDKALHILGNNWTSTPNIPLRSNSCDTGVAFQQ
jgi:hypothetical protein